MTKGKSSGHLKNLNMYVNQQTISSAVPLKGIIHFHKYFQYKQTNLNECMGQ